MITKGIIKQKVNSYSYEVDMPTLFDYEEATVKNAATICSSINNLANYTVGDTVLVSFEEHQYAKPIILGLLSSSSIAADLNLNSISNKGQLVLPNDTKIGDTDSFSLQNLSGIRTNIQEQVNSINTSFNDIETSIEEETTLYDDDNETIDDTKINIKGLREKLNLLKDKVGNKTDKDKTIYGRLNKLDVSLNKFNKILSNIPEGKTAKDLIDECLTKLEEKRTSGISMLPINPDIIDAGEWVIKVDDKIMKNNYLTESQANNNIKIFYKIGKSFGWSDISICGMLGCIFHESNVNPGAQGLYERYKTTGFRYLPTQYGIGLCMWTYDLHTEMVNWVTENYGNWYDGNGQMAFLNNQINTRTTKATSARLDIIPSDLRFKTAKEFATCTDPRWTLDMATTWWLACYEAGVGVSDYTSSWGGWFPPRQKKAKEIYNYLSNM